MSELTYINSLYVCMLAATTISSLGIEQGHRGARRGYHLGSPTEEERLVRGGAHLAGQLHAAVGLSVTYVICMSVCMYACTMYVYLREVGTYILNRLLLNFKANGSILCISRVCMHVLIYALYVCMYVCKLMVV